MPIAGNAVEMFENGAFFDALFEEIAAARADRCTSRPSCGRTACSASAWPTRWPSARAPACRCACWSTPTAARRWARPRSAQLEDAGCKLGIYHPQAPAQHRRAQPSATTARSSVLDGRVAWSAATASSTVARRRARTASTSATSRVRLRGPVVHAVQSAFSENWVEETGELFVGDDVFPPLEPAGDVAVARRARQARRLGAGGEDPASPGDLLRAQADLDPEPVFPARARRDRGARRRRCTRGVDVRVMVPSAEASDMPIVQHAAHRNFERAARRAACASSSTRRRCCTRR